MSHLKNLRQRYPNFGAVVSEWSKADKDYRNEINHPVHRDGPPLEYKKRIEQNLKDLPEIYVGIMKQRGFIEKNAELQNLEYYKQEATKYGYIVNGEPGARGGKRRTSRRRKSHRRTSHRRK